MIICIYRLFNKVTYSFFYPIKYPGVNPWIGAVGFISHLLYKIIIKLWSIRITKLPGKFSLAHAEEHSCRLKATKYKSGAQMVLSTRIRCTKTNNQSTQNIHKGRSYLWFGSIYLSISCWSRLQIGAVCYSRYWGGGVSIELLKCYVFKLTCVASVKYTFDFKDCLKKECKVPNNIYTDYVEMIFWILWIKWHILIKLILPGSLYFFQCDPKKIEQDACSMYL